VVPLGTQEDWRIRKVGPDSYKKKGMRCPTRPQASEPNQRMKHWLISIELAGQRKSRPPWSTSGLRRSGARGLARPAKDPNQSPVLGLEKSEPGPEDQRENKRAARWFERTTRQRGEAEIRGTSARYRSLVHTSGELRGAGITGIKCIARVRAPDL